MGAGETATNVEMRLKGKAVGGTFAGQNWSVKHDEMTDGDSVEFRFQATSGRQK